MRDEGIGLKVHGLGFRVLDLRISVSRSGLKVEGLRFGVQGSILGLGVRGQGLGCSYFVV